MHEQPRACVFAPSPLLTITVEGVPDERVGGEVHLHAGGQGFWIARLLVELGVDVVLCSSFGGETGMVARTLVAERGVEVRSIDAGGGNGAYVHDRRSGERVEVVSMPASSLSRHEVDELYGTTLVEALEADVCVIGGHADESVLPADTYRRLAADLRNNGRTVLADLSGKQLECALEGGVTALKVSEEELERDQRLESDDVDSLAKAMQALARAGAEHVVVTRGDEPSLALIDGVVLQVTAPQLEALESRGAGDALTAGMAASLARHEDLIDALRFGAAAGAINVTRRGLATGRREEIERLVDHVEVSPMQLG